MSAALCAEPRVRGGLGRIGIALAVLAVLVVPTFFSVDLAGQSSPSVTATPATVLPGGTIAVTVANGPGHLADWVAVVATTAPDSSYLDWKYLNGSTTPPLAGVTGAMLQLMAPTTPGTYEVRFWGRGGYTRLATSSPITVQGVLPLAPTVTATPATVLPGGTITVTVANGQGHVADWVAVVPTTAPDSSYLDWKYLNGSTTPPLAGLTSATLQLMAPTMPGTYEVRFWARGGYTRLATSAPLTVQGMPAPTATVTATPATVLTGETITVTVANAPGHVADWVAVVATTAPDSSFLDWKYLNGSTAPPLAGLTGATLQLMAPAMPGTYEVRFWARGGFTRLATSSPLTVQQGLPSSAVTVTATPATLQPGGTITATVANGPGHVADWVAVVATTAPDSSYLDWKYLNGSTAPPLTGLTSATVQLTAPLMPGIPGTYEVRFFARGGFTRLATSSAVTVADTIPPVISAVNVTAITSSGATFTWTTNEPSDSEVEYGPTTAYGGFSTLDVNLVTAHSVRLGGLAPTTLYHSRLRSRDAAGNLRLSGDVTFTTPEGIPPTIAITAPAPGAMLSGTVAVTATAADNVGVAGVQFQVDGAALGSEDTAAPYSVAWDTRTASLGLKSLTAVARDAAGNQAISAAVAVTVRAPQVELAWDAVPEPDIAGYIVYFGMASRAFSNAVVVGNVTGYTISDLQPGTVYYFAVTAYNSADVQSDYSNEVVTSP